MAGVATQATDLKNDAVAGDAVDHLSTLATNQRHRDAPGQSTEVDEDPEM